MKSFFEYPFNEEIRKKLQRYYENSLLTQHGEVQKLKIEIKLSRIEKLAKFNNDDIVLDIGCSSGYMLSKISSRIKEGIGLDIAESIIAENKERIKLSNITFETYDGINIPFDNRFTKVTMIDVLEHAFDPGPLMKSIYKCLRPGGELIVEVPFTGWLSELIFGRYHQGHLRYYDPKCLSEYMKKFGFEIKKIKTYNSVPLASRFIKITVVFEIFNFFVNLIPSKVYPYFGEIILVCTKR